MSSISKEFSILEGAVLEPIKISASLSFALKKNHKVIMIIENKSN